VLKELPHYSKWPKVADTVIEAMARLGFVELRDFVCAA
jgi:HD-like signal output (HDOD) protein